MMLQPGTNRGMTLLELVVGMTVLVILISLIAFIFKETTDTVNQTQEHLTKNAGVQMLDNRLREDLAGLCKDGFLCIVEGDPVPAGVGQFLGYNRPPAIIFTATGRFGTDVIANPSYYYNAALIAYVPSAEGRNPADMVGDMTSAMGRYVYSLTGGTMTGLPADANDLLGWTHPIDPDNNANPLDDVDAFGDALADVVAAAPRGPMVMDVQNQLYVAPAPGFFYKYINPFREDVRAFATGPATTADLRSLWPNVGGGHANVKLDIEYADVVLGGQLQWSDPDSTPLMTDPVLPGKIVYQTLDSTPSKYILWTGRNKTEWPRALRVTFTTYSADGAKEGQKYQMVIHLPR